MDKFGMEEYFEEIETQKQYNGYFYNVTEAVEIAILGSFCGLSDLKRIIQWAQNEKIRTFLKEECSIYEIPCYSWFTQILGNIKPQSFNQCFTKWVMSSLTQGLSGNTISLDGKTVRSTGKMKNYSRPLHIVKGESIT